MRDAPVSLAAAHNSKMQDASGWQQQQQRHSRRSSHIEPPLSSISRAPPSAQHERPHQRHQHYSRGAASVSAPDSRNNAERPGWAFTASPIPDEASIQQHWQQHQGRSPQLTLGSAGREAVGLQARLKAAIVQQDCVALELASQQAVRWCSKVGIQSDAAKEVRPEQAVCSESRSLWPPSQSCVPPSWMRSPRLADFQASLCGSLST